MKFAKSLSALLFGASLVAGSANAGIITIDFVQEAYGLGPSNNNEGGVEGDIFTSGGVSVIVTSSHDAYLDFNGDIDVNVKRAGLGVCSAGLTSGNQCSVSSDDNIQAGSATQPAEWVTLDFGSRRVTESSWEFNKKQHGPVDPADSVLFGLKDNLGNDNTDAAVLTSGYSLFGFGDIAGGVLGESFQGAGFYFNKISFASAGKEFYIGSATFHVVPLPGSIALLGVGLFAMGMVGRTRSRKKLAA